MAGIWRGSRSACWLHSIHVAERMRGGNVCRSERYRWVLRKERVKEISGSAHHRMYAGLFTVCTRRVH